MPVEGDLTIPSFWQDFTYRISVCRQIGGTTAHRLENLPVKCTREGSGATITAPGRTISIDNCTREGPIPRINAPRGLVGLEAFRTPCS